MTEKQKFSVVLVPAEPFFSKLKIKIDELAEVFDAPKFEPHMTVFSGYAEDLLKVTERFRQAARNFAKLSAVAACVDYTELFFKTLFVQFELSDELISMNELLNDKLDQESKYSLNPHLSLLYKKMPITTKASLSKEAWSQLNEILPSNRVILFDKIKMQTGSKKESPDTVREWKNLAEIKLS